MRVALIVDNLTIAAGTGIARCCIELLNGLKQRGIDVEPICIAPPNIPYGETIGHLFVLPYHVLRKINSFDLVHATSPVTGLCFPLIKKPKVITYYDCASLYSNYSGSAFHVRASAFLFYRIGKWSDRIISESVLTKKDLVDHLNLPADNIVVIPSGCDGRFEQMPPKKVQEYYTIGFVGALGLRKRLDYLINAFYYLKAKYPNFKARLVICGKKKEGEYSRLMGQVKALNLAEDIDFKGFIPDENLIETYNSFDVFAYPSEWEGFPIPILEAQRCGVPVIIRADAHIAPEESPYCLRAKSEEDMADKIYEILTNSNLRVDVVKKGLEYSKQFTWEKTVNETLKVYEEVLE